MSNKEENIPIILKNKRKCCGCGACFSICPKNAILMVSDEEGFLYPVIDSKKCIKCKKCLKVCAFKEKQKNREIF